ncbi:MAG: hypothetical protein E4H37_04900 [Gemmatimonadales bacterium]|nr:MAG: hypothetical protein E4H37_04900 [Gemmatimonadales bacterium]
MRRISAFMTAFSLVVVAACSDNSVFEPSQQNQVVDTKSGAASDGAFRVTVMTRNLYVGADVDAVIAALASTDPADDLPALFTAIEIIQRTDFPTRARAIAEEIDRVRPHVVGLQEVSEIDIDLTGLGLPIVIHQDFLASLDAALSDRGLNYVPAATIKNIEAVPFPGISLVDFDVMLVDPARVAVTSVVEQNFAANLGIVAPGLDIKRGWVTVTGLVDGAAYTFASTHLESGSLPGFPELRALQVGELVASLGPSSPAVLMGDLNDMPGSPMYEVLTGAGLTDVWRVLRPGVVGYTCCHADDLSNHIPAFDQRLDYVFVRGVGHANKAVMGQITLVGLVPASRLPGPSGTIWPSDHAGIGVDFLMPPARGRSP